MIKIKLVRYWLAMIFGMLMSTSMLVHATTKEQAVKAGFVFNITKFTVWPSDTSSQSDTFNLCLFGNDNLGGAIEALYGNTVRGKPLVIKHIFKDEDVKICHIAFVTKDSPKNIEATLIKLRSLPILTISDSPDFIRQGGMVGLIRNGRRVGFEVNLQEVKAARLHIGAQLLKLAKKVEGIK
jgi:hypothetical protein